VTTKPPLAYNLKFVACIQDHLHVLLLDEFDKEIGEFVFNTRIEFDCFQIAVGKAADDAFGKDIKQ